MPSPPPPATIFALSTPPGRAAIAVVRLSGPGVRDVLTNICPPLPEVRHASLRRLKEPSTAILLDEALVLYFQAPRTETGEDMAELHLHGGKAVVRAVLDTLARVPGLRPAEPGEFARRAFDNGKLDLARIEGLADLIDAETENQRRQAVAIATGTQSKRFGRWRDQLLASLALVEASIDFSDEGDVSARAVEQAEAQARTLADDLKRHLADGHRGEILRDGFRVVLAGAPNSGKSSLLNALARRDAAIVSEEAGTTRDIVEVRLDLEGHAVIVQDTAGLRETSSKVEQEGIRRSLQAAREADLVLWLSAADQTEPAANMAGDKSIRLLTKSDLIHVKQPPSSIPPAQAGTHIIEQEGKVGTPTIHVKQDPLFLSRNERECPERTGEGLEACDELNSAASPPSAPDAASRCSASTVSPSPLQGEQCEANAPFGLSLSTLTGEGLDDLICLITTHAKKATGDPHEPAITQTRHRQEVSNAILHLEAFLAGSSRAVELRAEELRLASLALARLTGRLDAETVLGAIFSRFCIGK